MNTITEIHRGPLSLEELAADADDLVPTSEEILDVVMETFGLARNHALRLIAAMDTEALKAPT